MDAIRNIPTDYFVFVDEMSATNRTRRRRRGRAGRGKAAYMREFFSKTDLNMNTLIAACNSGGMLVDACAVTNHNNSRDDFEEYVSTVLLPSLGPFPGDASFFISFHAGRCGC